MEEAQQPLACRSDPRLLGARPHRVELTLVGEECACAAGVGAEPKRSVRFVQPPLVAPSACGDLEAKHHTWTPPVLWVQPVLSPVLVLPLPLGCWAADGDLGAASFNLIREIMIFHYRWALGTRRPARQAARW